MPKQIIFSHGGGRLANQLTNFGHLIAFIEEHRDEFVLNNIAFRPYAQLFNEFTQTRHCIYPPQAKVSRWFSAFVPQWTWRNTPAHIMRASQLLRLLHLWAYVCPGWQSIKSAQARYDVRKYTAGASIPDFNFDSESYVNMLRSRHTVLAGWPIRSWQLFEKHQDAIRTVLTVQPKFSDAAQNFIASIRQQYGYVVGVLLRQDDYRVWNGGRFFFESERYAQWISEAEALLKDKNVAFVIASDEAQSKELFNAKNIFFAPGQATGTGHYMKNFATLALCDMLMSPPSTFSVWAAFLGNRPLWPLCTDNQILNSNDILPRHIFDAIHHPYMKEAIK